MASHVPDGPARIAVVEDEASLRRDLVDYLTHCGHAALGVDSGMALDRAGVEGRFDLAILDVGLPGEDGFSIARRLRDASDIGIVMLTARGAVTDRIRGLDHGADVYMAKPVDLRELAAQVRRLLGRVRRAGLGPASRADASGTEEGWVYDPVAWELRTPGGAGVRLTGSESRIVALMAARPAQPVSRDDLFKALGKPAWESDDRSVDALVRRLRLKVQQQTGEDLPLRSVRAVGYVFAAPVVRR